MWTPKNESELCTKEESIQISNGCGVGLFWWPGLQHVGSGVEWLSNMSPTVWKVYWALFECSTQYNKMALVACKHSMIWFIEGFHCNSLSTRSEATPECRCTTRRTCWLYLDVLFWKRNPPLLKLLANRHLVPHWWILSWRLYLRPCALSQPYKPDRASLLFQASLNFQNYHEMPHCGQLLFIRENEKNAFN